MRHVSPCLVVPFVLACAACGLVGPDETKFQVQGQVTAADDGSPLAGAPVEFFYCEPEGLGCTPRRVDHTTADAQGHYELSYVHSGVCRDTSFSLEATAPFFLVTTIRSADDPHIICTEEMQTIDVQLLLREGSQTVNGL